MRFLNTLVQVSLFPKISYANSMTRKSSVHVVVFPLSLSHLVDGSRNLLSDPSDDVLLGVLRGLGLLGLLVSGLAPLAVEREAARDSTALLRLLSLGFFSLSGLVLNHNLCQISRSNF